jgi:hypothetical protein
MGGVKGKTKTHIKTTNTTRAGDDAERSPGIGIKAKIPPTLSSINTKCRTSPWEMIRSEAPRSIHGRKTKSASKKAASLGTVPNAES